MGVSRIIPAKGIPYPLGDPEMAPAAEKALRRRLVEKALAAIASPIEEQTIFEA